MKDLLLGPVKYLLREVTDTGSQLLEIRANDRVLAKKGAIYAVLDAGDLDPIDVLLGTRRGDTLIITLPDGTLIELEGYFPEKGGVDTPTFADFSSETLLKITDEEEAKEEGGANWMLWGLGGAAVLGGAALAAGQSGGGDGSDITVSVGGDDEPSTKAFNITGLSSRSLIENREYISETPKTQNEDGAVTWSLEGEDAELFIVNTETGVVSMQAQDFEEPSDGGSNNSYRYVLVATDAAGNETREPVTVVITDEVETRELSIQGLESTQLLENVDYDWSTPLVSNAVGKITWELSGEDADRFDQDPITGALTFRASNYESPADFNADNVYRLRVTARDEDDNYTYKDLTVEVNDAIEASQINLFGINDSVVMESATFFSNTPTVSGAIGDVTWRLEGDDAALFNLDSQTGAISLAAQDFEAPVDVNGDNTYSVVLTAIDEDGNQVQRPLKVAVLDRDESASSGGGTGTTTKAFNITGLSSRSLIENREYISETPKTQNEDGAVTWSLEGEDAELFIVNTETGVVSMQAQDFEEPSDGGSNNSYRYVLVATDAAGNETREPVTVVITDEVETRELSIQGLESTQLLENVDYDWSTPLVSNAVGKITWELSGEDADRFDQDPITGALTFRASNYESPADFNADNVYRLRVTARDEDDNYTYKDLTVEVNDAIEASQINLFGINDSVVMESATFFSNTPTVSGAIGDVTWRLEGDDAALFNLDSQTGAISLAAQDFEAPVDVNGDNTYNVVLTAIDEDGNQVQRPLKVAVLDRDESASSGGGTTTVVVDGATAATEKIKGLTDVMVLEHRDATLPEPWIDGISGPFTWSIYGADAEFFAITADTGAITFKGAEFADYENPLDVNRDNTYLVSVRATSLTTGEVATKDLELTVVNDVFEVVADDSGITRAFPEELIIFENNTVALPTPTVPGIDGEVTWVLSGDDAARFTIDSETGLISQADAFDFERPTDANADNSYSVQLVALQGGNIVARHNMRISVQDVAEDDATGTDEDTSSPLFTVNGLTNVMVEEHKNFQSLDPWITGTSNALDWSLFGEDADFFTIDAASGVISFAAQDYENPLDLGRDNTYRYGVRVEDPLSGQVVTKNLVLYVVDDPGEWGSSAIVKSDTVTAFDEVTEVAENTLFKFSKPDALSAVGTSTWSIRGEDAQRFAVDPTTGVITLTGKNFEAPTDSNADNIYSIELVARDEDMNIAWIPLSVRVTDVVEVSQISIAGIQNDSVRENFEYESDRPVALGAIGNVQWSIDGDDVSHFAINQYTGVLTMQAKDFELPGSLSGDNVYRVRLTATDDDGNTAAKNLAVAVDNVNETGDTVNSGNTGDSGTTDTAPPTLVNISSSAGSTDYHYDETVYITAAFSKPVKFLQGAIAPVLELSNGGEATYYNGNGTYQITFEYTVQASDKSDNLNVDRVRLGSLIGANNADFLESNIELITSNLLDNAVINLDATPRIVEITSAVSDGTYGEGAVIPIQVILDQAVTVQSNGVLEAVLPLNNGRQATYISGSGSDTLLFEYIVGSDDDITDLNVLAFAENEQVFKNSGGLELSDGLASMSNGNLSDNTDINIGQPQVPSIIAITSPTPDGVYILGDSIIVDVDFDAPVFLESNGGSFSELSASEQDAIRPYLALNSGGTAKYISGSGTSTLRFVYEAEESEISPDLDVSSLAENGTSFVDAQGNAVETAIVLGTLSTVSDLVVDADSPEIVSMTNTQSPIVQDDTGYFVSGEIAITFSSEVSVIGADSKLIISNLDDVNNQSFPAIGNFERVEADNRTVVFSYEGYLFDEVMPIEATALIENGTVIMDINGNSAKTKITSGDNDIAGTLLAGAGEFVSSLLGLRVLATDGAELLNTAFDPNIGFSDFAAILAQQSSGPILFEIYDINGVDPDYRDEYTGLLKSLGDNVGSYRSLRVVVDTESLASRDGDSPLTVTPLSELAVRLGNKISGETFLTYPLTDEYLIANQLVADLFGIADITVGPISFVDWQSFDVTDGLDEAELFGLALAMLSTLDTETGGLFDTLELLLSAWSEEAQINQLGLPSPGSLKDFLHQALALIDSSTNSAVSVETRLALQEYVSALNPYQPKAEPVRGQESLTVEESIDSVDDSVDEASVAEDSAVPEVSSDDIDVGLSEASTEASAVATPAVSELVDTASTLDEAADGVTDSADEDPVPEVADSALTDTLAESQQASTMTTDAIAIDATALLFTPSSELSRELTGLMGKLSTETDASVEADLMHELAVHTAASRVRAALLAPMDSAEVTSVNDYEQLGFTGVAAHNLGLVDSLVAQALSDGDATLDVIAQVSDRLAQFEILRTWALQDGETEETIVTVDQDTRTQLDKVADKLDVLFPHSDYDDTLVDFLTEQMLGDDERYVFASMDVPNGAALLSAVELPVTQLSELLSAGSILIEGRDAEGRWQPLSEVVAVEGDSGVIALDASYQGFSAFRVSGPSTVSAELRDALVGAAVSFETRALETEALASTLEGVEHLAALSPTLAAQLLSWSGADTWSDYAELNQVLPTFNALQAGYASFYEGTPDADALRSMLRLSLSLPSVEGSEPSALQASAGDFGWSDIEVLTGIELDSDADVAALLSELSAAYAGNEGIEAVVSALHHKAWLAESEGLLDASFDELASRVFALSNDDTDDAGVLQEVARLGSVIKFKQLLDGTDVALTIEDVAQFGLGDLAETQLTSFARYVSTHSAALHANERDLHDVFEAFESHYAESQLALDSLLSGPSWVEREVSLTDGDSLSRLMTLLSTEYGDNQTMYSGLVTTILGAVAGTERTLATIELDEGPADYLSFLDASGEPLSSLAGISVRGYRSFEDVEGELLSLTMDTVEAGRFVLPSTTMDYSHLELVTTGYPMEIQQIASIRVMGVEHDLSTSHLEALGYEGLDADDIPRLYQLASAGLMHNENLTVDELVTLYQQLKPLHDLQETLPSVTPIGTWAGAMDSMSATADEQLAGLWQWTQESEVDNFAVFPEHESTSLATPLGSLVWPHDTSVWHELADNDEAIELVTKDDYDLVWGEETSSGAMTPAQVTSGGRESFIDGSYILDGHIGLGSLSGIDVSWIEKNDSTGELQ